MTSVADPPPLRSHEWIAGLEKGLAVIEAFDAEHSRMTAAEVGRRSNMTRTASRRYLKTLTHLGYMATDGKLYWLLPRTLRLGHAFIVSARLPKLVQPLLQHITNETGEVAYLGVVDHGDTIFLARGGSPRHTASGYWPGARVPAQITAAGLAILASWPDHQLERWLKDRPLPSFTPHTLDSIQRIHAALKLFKRQKWALSEQQLELNYRGIAVPLLDRRDDVHGAISVTMPINREETDHALTRVLPVLQEAAKSLRPLL